MVTGTRRANYPLLFRTPVFGYQQVPSCFPSSCTVVIGTALSASGCSGEAILLCPFALAGQKPGRSVSQAQRTCLCCNMCQPRRSPGIQEHCLKAAVEVCPLHSSVDILERAALPPAVSVSNARSLSSLRSSEVSWSARSSPALNSAPPAAPPTQRWARWPGDRSHGGSFQRLAILDCRRRAGLYRTSHRGLHPILPLEGLVQAE